MNTQRVARWIQQCRILRCGIRVAARLVVPRQYVGAVGAVFNETGQVLLVRHVYRADHPWGLPGGWLKLREHPGCGVRREIEEELSLNVEVKSLLLCEPQGSRWICDTPPGLGLAYYCRLCSENADASSLATATHAHEVLDVLWVDPDKIEHDLIPFQLRAIRMGRAVFDREAGSS